MDDKEKFAMAMALAAEAKCCCKDAAALLATIGTRHVSLVEALLRAADDAAVCEAACGCVIRCRDLVAGQGRFDAALAARRAPRPGPRGPIDASEN